MGRVVENAVAHESRQLPRVVVDQEVGAQDALVAAVDDVRGEINGKCLPSQRYLALKDVGTSIAAVAMKTS